MSTSPRKKTDRMAWFKMDPGAFLGETRGLPAANVGFYIQLMALYWTQGNRLPTERRTLMRQLGVITPEDEAVLDEVLADFFPNGHHVGLDDYLEEVKANSKMQAERAHRRWAVQPTPAADPNDF